MLSVVIPCYNEEERLPATVDAIKRYLGARGDRYELILADDGSMDGTQKVIAAAMAGASNVRDVHLVQNRGARMAEVPVVWRHSAPTRVAAIRHSVDMFKDLVGVRFRRYAPSR